MRQDSKRGHYYCTEECSLMRCLNEIRSENVIMSRGSFGSKTGKKNGIEAGKADRNWRGAQKTGKNVHGDGRGECCQQTWRQTRGTDERSACETDRRYAWRYAIDETCDDSRNGAKTSMDAGTKTDAKPRVKTREFV